MRSEYEFCSYNDVLWKLHVQFSHIKYPWKYRTIFKIYFYRIFKSMTLLGCTKAKEEASSKLRAWQVNINLFISYIYLLCYLHSPPSDIFRYVESSVCFLLWIAMLSCGQYIEKWLYSKVRNGIWRGRFHWYNIYIISALS